MGPKDCNRSRRAARRVARSHQCIDRALPQRRGVVEWGKFFADHLIHHAQRAIAILTHATLSTNEAPSASRSQS